MTIKRYLASTQFDVPTPAVIQTDEIGWKLPDDVGSLSRVLIAQDVTVPTRVLNGQILEREIHRKTSPLSGWSPHIFNVSHAQDANGLWELITKEVEPPVVSRPVIIKR